MKVVGVEPERFRRDPFLRVSAYNLGTWALVNMLFSLPAYAQAAGAPWTATRLNLYALALIGGGIWMSILNERRVGKMLGPASADDALFAATRLWGPLLLLAVASTVALLVDARPQFLQPLWLTVVGTAYLVWGCAVRLAVYAGLGAALLAGGLFVFSLQQPAAGAAPSVLGLHVWNLSMGLGSIAVAVFVSRRYVWPRA